MLNVDESLCGELCRVVGVKVNVKEYPRIVWGSWWGGMKIASLKTNPEENFQILLKRPID